MGYPTQKSDTMEVLVLGPGCAKCKRTCELVKQVVEQYHLDCDLREVDDMEEIMRYRVVSTPALVVDGQVVIRGHVPTAREIAKVLGVGQ